jgi:hypothetical protein
MDKGGRKNNTSVLHGGCRLKALSGRPKKCGQCKKPFKPERSFQPCCSVPCAILYARKQNEKEQKVIQKQRKEGIKRDSEWREETQTLFNKMRRLEELLWFKVRNLEPFCISCQKPLGNDIWCCGHYHTRKARQDLAFDRLNTYLQHNRGCNEAQSGDIRGMERGFAVRFGNDEAERIIDHCMLVKPAPKRSADDWKAMKKEFSSRIRELTKKLESD